MDTTDYLDNWLNGNRKDVVMAIIASGKFSEAIEFAMSLDDDDRLILLKMFRNRDK